MPEINLLQKEFQKKSGLGRQKRPFGFSFYLILFLLLVEVVFYGFLLLGQQRTAKNTLDIEKEIAAVDFELSKTADQQKAALSYQSRLNFLDKLLLEHLFWSQVLAELENVTYKQARYESLQVEEKKHKFIIAGTTSSYTDLAKLMVGLKTSPSILDVIVQNASLAEQKEGGYSFNLEVTFDPKLLIKP